MRPRARLSRTSRLRCWRTHPSATTPISGSSGVVSATRPNVLGARRRRDERCARRREGTHPMSGLDARAFTVGPLQENAYIVLSCGKLGHALIAPPGEEPERLLA